MPVNIYIIESQPVLRDVLCVFLSKLHDLEVCGTAKTTQEALAQLRKVTADVVLIDMSLPGTDGLACTKEVHARHPELCALLLTDNQVAIDVQQVLAAGARGCIDKETPQELEWAIWQVLTGEVYISRQLQHEWLGFRESAQ